MAHPGAGIKRNVIINNLLDGGTSAPDADAFRDQLTLTLADCQQYVIRRSLALCY
jgi:hypothetical protein